MKVSDIPHELLKEGIRVQSMKDPDNLGTITEVEDEESKTGREPITVIRWDDKDTPDSSFFWNDCECEVVPQMQLEIDGSTIDVVNCWWEGPDFYVHDFSNKVMCYTNAWFSHSSVCDMSDGEPSITEMDFNYSPVLPEEETDGRD